MIKPEKIHYINIHFYRLKSTKNLIIQIRYAYLINYEVFFVKVAFNYSVVT